MLFAMNQRGRYSSCVFEFCFVSCFRYFAVYTCNNTIDTGDFFDKTSSQGRIRFGKFCANVRYAENAFADSGFMNAKEIVKTDSILVRAQIPFPTVRKTCKRAIGDASSGLATEFARL